MRLPRAASLVVALTSITAVALAGCGSASPNGANASSSTPNAQKLLSETFSARHPVRSGQIELVVNVIPTGSSVLTAPITIALGGPFQSGADGKLPRSDFTVTASAQGHHGKLAIISTGSAGYITVNGDSFQLPAASYDKLRSGLSSVSGSSRSPAASSGSSMLSKLGVDPLSWLTDPRVIGQGSVGGVTSDHISARVNVAGLLADLDKLAGRASSLGLGDAGQLSGGLSASERSSIAAHIRSPSVEIWTGASDQTLRRLSVALTVPVTGTLHKSLGGLSSLRITVELQYSDLNQPQTITAPTKLLPYSQLQTKIASDLETIEGGVLGGVSGTLGATTTGASSGLTGVEERYSACMIEAAGNVVKQQACSPILAAHQQ